jgi:CubicO group peptidase (beta-lactamase class C family)
VKTDPFDVPPPQPCRVRRKLVLLGAAATVASVATGARAQIRAPSTEDQAQDGLAFADVQERLAQRWTDVESVAVVQHGRLMYEFYRDGAPDKLRNVQSVEKSALAAVAGVALARGELPHLDIPVVTLVPEWAALNADPRSRQITVRHLLTMSAGFDTGSATSITGKLPPAQGWSRPLAAAPGERFAYDNAIVVLLPAVIERVTGLPLPEYARRHLVEPLAMTEPLYRGILHLRTVDMAKLGQLFLQQGQWAGRQLLPPEYVAAATQPQNSGGPPVAMPYGYFWWILPHAAPRRAFMASGYAGQMIWVNPSLGMVLAVTSTVSADSQRRGHALDLLRSGVLPAVERRSAAPALR